MRFKSGSRVCQKFAYATSVLESALTCTYSLTATPRQRVYLHYDYLVFSGPAPHSDVPDRAAIQMVVDKSAEHGIDTIIDNHHTAIPGGDAVVVTEEGGAYLCRDRFTYF